MKLKVSQEKEFTPVDIQLTLETELELKIMLAISNVSSDTVLKSSSNTAFQISKTATSRASINALTESLYGHLSRKL